MPPPPYTWLITTWFAGGGGGVTPMLTVWLTAGFTLSESVAVKLAVPEKPPCSVTLNVAVALVCPAVTFTIETPVPPVADQL